MSHAPPSKNDSESKAQGTARLDLLWELGQTPSMLSDWEVRLMSTELLLDSSLVRSLWLPPLQGRSVSRPHCLARQTQGYRAWHTWQKRKYFPYNQIGVSPLGLNGCGESTAANWQSDPTWHSARPLDMTSHDPSTHKEHWNEDRCHNSLILDPTSKKGENFPSQVPFKASLFYIYGMQHLLS